MGKEPIKRGHLRNQVKKVFQDGGNDNVSNATEKFNKMNEK